MTSLQDSDSRGEGDVSRETLASSVEQLFGEHLSKAQEFRRLLEEQGELRGLIGPREVARVWDRHVLNSAAVTARLSTSGSVVDIGSGAGLPGIVLAIMRPELEVELVEPMERRVEWLRDVASRLELTNVTVTRARAEEIARGVDAVVARAVAPLAKLASWAVPLLRPGGRLVAQKGARAGEELRSARKELRRLRVAKTSIVEVTVVEGAEPTWLVCVERGSHS